MTRLVLVRHGQTAAVGKRLVGRAAGIHLDSRGVAQAKRVAGRLAEVPLAAVYSSPLERAIETAAPIAAKQQLEVEILAGFAEIDFGHWTGCTFDELADLPEWQRFNSVRSCTRIPGGEHWAQVQARVIGEIERIERTHPSETVVIVSHADVIRTALAYCAAIPIDLFLRVEVCPASISTIRLNNGVPHITGVNITGQLGA